MAKSKKSKSKKLAKKPSSPKPKKSSKKTKGKSTTSTASSRGPSPLMVGLGVAALAGVAFLVWPRRASAATLPARTGSTVVSARGTRPSTRPARTARTAAKPQMPADLRTLVMSSDDAKLIFWMLAATYMLDSRAGAPTDATVEQLMGGSFPTAVRQALARLGAPGGANPPLLDLVEFLYNRVNGTRFDLPYQVPSAVWDHVNVFFKDLFGTDDASFSEPT